MVRAAGHEAARSQKRSSKGRGLAPVRRISDERAYLYQIIQTIGAGPDLDAILRGVIHLVTEATACHACFVYFVKDHRLELRAASAMYAHLEGRVEIPIGEGLTGWAVRSRRSAFIREGALEDPRVQRAYFPELGDEHYESLVTVPIFSRSGDVIGAITLHAEAPHEFARADLDFLEHTASLIAGAVDNARLFEEASSRVDLLSDLSRLSQRIASASDTGEVLAAVTEGTRKLLGADSCDIYLADTDGLPALRAANPDRTANRTLDAPRLASALGQMEGGVSVEGSRRLAALVWGSEAGGIPLFAPIVAGEERLGLLGVRLPEPKTDAETALLAIASHAAVAIKQHEVIDSLTEKNLVKDLFQALTRIDNDPDTATALAERLGCDVGAPHLVLSIVPTPVSPRRAARTRASARPPDPIPWRDVAGRVAARLIALLPGTLVDQLERSMRALVPLVEDSPEATVDVLRDMRWEEGGGVPLAVGVSNLCRGAASFARGFMEAESAAEVGALIRGTPGVATYEDLGPYRYVLSTDQGLRDAHQERLQRLVDYDRRRGTELLDTLEGYLDHRGGVVATSRALYIHPNTLRQRLDRIERASGIDVDRDDWLSLAVATKIVKLQTMRQRRGATRNGDEEGRGDG
jgi:GAF domain-containing protein/sugar diacid utilization regulator